MQYRWRRMWRDFKIELSSESRDSLLISPLNNKEEPKSLVDEEIANISNSNLSVETATTESKKAFKRRSESNITLNKTINQRESESEPDRFALKAEYYSSQSQSSQFAPKGITAHRDKNMASSMFDISTAGVRQAPEIPTTDGVEYPRAASWVNETLENVLKDEKGRQLFRVFLHDALAEENLAFIESFQKFKKMTDDAEKRQYIEEFFTKYSPYVNLSSVAMQKIRETAASSDPDPAAFTLAVKEVNRLLENDQFPRFKRSEIYVNFLEKLLPRAYAEKWTTSFEALLGNQIGRHYFRIFLRNIHAEENLRFWESVIEFKQMKNKSTAMLNMSRNIQKQFLIEGAFNEVFLPFGVRQVIDKHIADEDVDAMLFDEAIKHVEQVLKNDPYVRFIQSKEYNDLLKKLS